MEKVNEYLTSLFDEEPKEKILDVTEYPNCFELPITYLKDKYELADNIYTDLELIETKDGSNCLYDCVFENDNILGKQLLKNWSKYYTTDETFLKDSQKLYESIDIDIVNDNKKTDTIYNNYLNKLNDNNFKTNFDYIEWKYFNFLNHSTFVLQTLCIYNMTSPVISLVMPIIMLLVPFLILKLQGIPINVKEYSTILEKLIQNDLIGKMLRLHTMPLKQAIYTICSFGFYLFSLYQNINHCYRFNNNLYLVNNTLIELREYNNITIKNMEKIIKSTENLKTYSKFNETLLEKMLLLKELNNDLINITPYELNPYKLIDIGYVLQVFYRIFQDKETTELLMYSFGFNGYICNILDIKMNIDQSFINKSKFNKNKISFTNSYYAPLKKSCIKNTYSVNKNMLITGPNAAGKTTLLKSTMFNLILIQQIGYGFFSKSNVCLHNYFHCYLNIPDTSGRDSLFQAEARRCKEILDIIINKTHEKHFCIFDELYSGTNPYEAVASAYAYLLYIIENHKNFRFMITTHYLDLCKKLKSKVKNTHMEVLTNDKNFEYTYLVKNGTSSVKGGLKVLKDLNYPELITEKAEKLLYNL